MSFSILRQMRIVLLVLATVASVVSGAAWAAGPSNFHTITPCRVFDSRLPADAPALQDGVERIIQVTGPECGVPADAESVSLNVTVIPTDPPGTGTGEMFVYPGDAATPTVGGFPFFVDKVRSKIEIVELASDVSGTIAAQADLPAGQSVHLAIDVNGYFMDSAQAVNDVATVNEDSGATTLDVRLNDNGPPGGGPFTIGSVTQPANGTVVITNAGADLTYEPDPNYCNDGSPTDNFTYTLTPGNSTATVAVTVTCVNDAPAGTDNAVSTGENTDYVFATADFGFTDPNDTPANALLAVKITTLPSLGSLTLSGGAVSAGQTIAVADITAGNLEFAPAVNGSGSPYTSFTFQVQDDGGTANGGVDLDPTPNTMTINVIGVNNAPEGTDNTVTTPEDVPYTFAAVDFGFTDPLDTPPNNLASVVITTLPALGSLTLSGSGFAAGTEIAVADINAGNLKFTPVANASGSPYTTFTFQVRDDGGTAGGGVDLDPTPNTMTIDVTAVNDPPAGADNTVTTPEDTPYTFTAADFGFTDPIDSPANLLQAVKITTLPAAGTLTLSGSGFAAGTDIPVADINAGNLKFTPAANGSGSPYTTFTFQVRDDGGTAGGGVDLDPTPNTMTVDVTANNDAPAGTNNTVTTPEDTPYTFTAADFGFTDPNDTPANNLASVVITTLPALGSLTLSGGGFAAGTEIPVASINAGNLKFTPAANGSGIPYTTFTFQVRDDGGTAGGGVDLDPTPNTMTVDVTAVNDAPAGTNGTVIAFEDTQYTFTAANFGFTDPNDTPANNLASVVITTLPGAGSLTLSGSGFAAGTEIPVASITAGNLKFTPAANASGSPYTTFTFQVRDDGGTAGGGVDLDPSPNTMTVDVTAVNDAPAGTNNTVTTDEDVQYTFTAADFGFTDPLDTPANALASVVITTLPGAGSLTLSGSGFAAGTEISVANITAGNLKFLAAANAFGSPYASFTFQVRDDGGTANGGVNLDPTPNTMTINVTPVNDAPTVLPESFDVLGNTELRVDLAAGTTPHTSETTTGPSSYKGVLDNDGDIEGDVVKITAIGSGWGDFSPPVHCALADGAVVHVEENGEFSYTPGPGDTSGSFAYTVTDVPAFGIAISIGGTVTFNHSTMVWWVDPAAGAGTGTSISPFNTLDSLDGIGGGSDSDGPGHYIFVHDGTLALSGPMEMEANQHLIGQGNVNTGPAAGFALSIPVNLNGNGSPTNLVATGTHPQLANASGNTVTVGNAIPLEIAGLSLAGGTTAGGGSCGSPTFACNAIDLTSAGALGSSTLTIINNVIRGAGAEGIDINLNASTTGTLALNVALNSWDLAGTHTGNAVDINRAAGTLNLDFSGNTNIKSNNAAGAAVLINGGAAANTNITGFSGNSISGDALGAGLVISGATFDSNTTTGGIQQVDGDNLAIGGSVNPVSGAGMSLATVLGDLRFDDLDIYAGTSGLAINGAMAFAVTPAAPDGLGTSTIDADNGAAVDITAATIDLRLADMDSTTTGSGLSLNTVGANSQFRAPSGSSIVKSSGAGTAFSVASSGTGTTVSYGGTLNVTSGAGVSLTNNGGSTFGFTGLLTLSTGGSAAFSATGGGTVTSTDTSSTLTTSNGVALNVANTTIGASGLKFRSITAGTPGTGPANAIVLNNTGSSGGLTVSGTGSAGSGGTIRTAGTGINLTSTRDVSLSWMQMNDFTDFAIRGSSVVNFTLANTTINGTSGNDASADEGSVRFTELTGSASITNCNISGAVETNVRIVNTSGTLNRLTIDGTTIGANHATTGDDGLFVQAAGSSVVNVTVQNSFFTSARGDLVNTDVPTGGGTLDLIFTGNALSNNHPGIVSGGGGTTFSAVGGTFTYDILNNSFRGANGAALAVSGGNNGVNTSGTIEGNTIGVAGAGNENSGSASGSAIAWVFAGGGTHTAKIHNNNLRGYNNHGILVQVGDQMGNPTNANVTVTQNTVQNPGTINTDFNAIHLNHGVVGTDSFTSCVDIGGAGVLKNVVNGGGKGTVSPNNNDIRLRQRQATTVRLPGYGGANNDNTAVQTYLTGRNTLTTVNASNTVPTGGGYIGGAACAQP